MDLNIIIGSLEGVGMMMVVTKTTMKYFRELLTRMDSTVRQLRQCAATGDDSAQQERVLKELEQTFRDVMLLIQR